MRYAYPPYGGVRVSVGVVGGSAALVPPYGGVGPGLGWLVEPLRLFHPIYRILHDCSGGRVVSAEVLVNILSRAPPATLPTIRKDLEARWTKKHGKSYFGYKAHVSADVRYKRVRKTAVTAAAVHDTKHFEDLLEKATPRAR